MDANRGRSNAGPPSSKVTRFTHRATLKAILLFAVVLTAVLVALAGPAGCLPFKDPRSPRHEPRAGPGENLQNLRPAAFVAGSAGALRRLQERSFYGPSLQTRRHSRAIADETAIVLIGAPPSLERSRDFRRPG